jgi:hypothetical protein
MYDPILGRFLEADPYVADGTFSQDFNRYSYARNNPLVYTDPSGENPILIAAFIGGFINLALNDRGSTNFWQKLGYFGIGAAGGALGAGVGIGISSAMGAGTGFISGAVIGSGAGFSSGFTVGLGNGIMQGQNFGTALGSGVQSGLIGGLFSGAIGGIASGISSISHGGNFWNGSGATFDKLSATSFSSNSIEVGEGMEYSNEYAQNFSDTYFGKIKGLDNLYGNGNVPNDYVKKGDLVFNPSGQQVLGTTSYKGLGKGYDVYLYKATFTAKEKLYLTMGHEYYHVELFRMGLNMDKHHNEISYWENMQQCLWNMTYDKAYINSTYRYYQYLPLLSIKPW